MIAGQKRPYKGLPQKRILTEALIDQLQESHLEPVRRMLEYPLHPHSPSPALEHMHQLGAEYKRLVEQRFREMRKPGTLGSGSGTGFLSTYDGMTFGRQSFHWSGCPSRRIEQCSFVH
jgi:hypothetical protein